MGMTEDFQCGNVRENYERPCKRPYTSTDGNPGSNYTSSPLPVPSKNPFVNSPVDGISPSGDFNIDKDQVMVFDRPMTTTLKTGRFARSGVCDFIRGDLPVAPNACQGWFSTPADPTALRKGALQAIAGENESSTVLNEFMKSYGYAGVAGAGVNMEDDVDHQYTAYEMAQKSKGVANNTISVTNF